MSWTPDVVRAWLHEVKDPEVPVVSVVELGVVRDVVVDGDDVTVEITPTYSGCPAMKVMEEEILACLASHGVASPRVRVVFREPWTTEWMSEDARGKLLAYGIAPPQRMEAQGLVSLRRAVHVACPRCGSQRTLRQSEFGSTACKALYTCRECGEPFDYFKAI